jgi:hypothetical protein
MGERSRSSYSVNLPLTGLPLPSFSAQQRGVEMYTVAFLAAPARSGSVWLANSMGLQ